MRTSPSRTPGRLDLKASTLSIRACGKKIQWHAALGHLKLLRKEELFPDCIAYTAAMVTCRVAGEWRATLELWKAMRSAGVETDIITCGAVVTAYEMSQAWQQAQDFLQTISLCQIRANLVTLNTVLSALESRAEWQQAERTLQDLHAQDMKTDIITLNTAVSILHGQWTRSLGCLNSINWGIRADVITYSSAISKIEDSQWHVGSLFLSKLRAQQISADTVVYNSVCFSSGGHGWQQAQQTFAFAKRGSLRPSHVTYNTMISVFGGADQWKEAGNVLQDLEQTLPCSQERTSHNSMISSFAKAGEWRLAVSALRQLQQHQIELDLLTFSGAISACEKGGYWEHAFASFV